MKKKKEICALWSETSKTSGISSGLPVSHVNRIHQLLVLTDIDLQDLSFLVCLLFFCD